MMATPAKPVDELIEEAIPGSSSSFDRPPWTSTRKEKIHDLGAAHRHPHQMTGEEGRGLIGGDATPPPRRLPPLLPPEKNSREEESEDGPDLAKGIRSPTRRLHKGKQQRSTT
jgi:hypothetical protein